MDLKDIQSLIKFVSRSGVCEVNLEMDDVKISIKNKNESQPDTTIVQRMPVEPVAVQQPVVAAVPEAAAPAPAPAAAPPAEASSEPKEDDSKYVTITSPMIGTFYRRPSPDKDIFVNVGDEIRSGTVVCIIEAMKLFNEIESEVSGKIVKALVEDGSPVEYDQPLFLVDPS